MKSKYVVSGILLFLLFMTMGCDNVVVPSEKNLRVIQDLDYEQIYDFKTPYIGDSVKASGLARSLHYADLLHDGIELQTSQEPYALIANYVVEQPENYATLTDKMLENAAIIFALIDNADSVVLKFSDRTNSVVHTFERDYVEQLVGMKLSFFGESYDAFSNGLIPVLDVQIWEEEEQTVILTKIQELYLWQSQDGDNAGQILATLLPGTNREKTAQEIYNYEIALRDFEAVNEILLQNDFARRLYIRQDLAISKEEVLDISRELEFKGHLVTIGGMR